MIEKNLILKQISYEILTILLKADVMGKLIKFWYILDMFFFL